MQKLSTRFALISGCIFSMLVYLSFATEPAVDDPTNSTNLPQIVRAPNINKQFDWSGEIVPYTADARERLDRELLSNSYFHSNMIQYLKLSNRYFPMIERVFREKGIPDDFKYLAVAESGLRNVVSHAKAKGLWQFMTPAAKERGLEVNDEVDERYHVEKATYAAAEYILYLKKRFGNWTNAAAAYNMGPTAFAREQKEQQQEDYYDLNLSQETMRYVFRLVAIKEIMQSPESFGYYISSEEMYPTLDDYYEIHVDKSVNDWAQFATDKGVTYRELKRYNPWLRDDHLTVINNTYKIKIPRQG